jgi:hypothetical protein
VSHGLEQRIILGLRPLVKHAQKDEVSITLLMNLSV